MTSKKEHVSIAMKKQMNKGKDGDVGGGCRRPNGLEGDQAKKETMSEIYRYMFEMRGTNKITRCKEGKIKQR